jgi:hypothetical protein
VNRGGHLLDGNGLREMLADPGYGFGHTVYAGFGRSDLGDACANRRAKQPNQDFVDHERAEEVRILRPGHQCQQARHGFDDVVGGPSDIEPTLGGVTPSRRFARETS